MFDKLKMVQQAREMQKKLKNIQIDSEYNGTKIVINGKQELISIDINEELIGDKNALEKNIKEAFNNALAKSQREIATSMQGDLGSLFGM